MLILFVSFRGGWKRRKKREREKKRQPDDDDDRGRTVQSTLISRPEQLPWSLISLLYSTHFFLLLFLVWTSSFLDLRKENLLFTKVSAEEAEIHFILFQLKSLVLTGSSALRTWRKLLVFFHEKFYSEKKEEKHVLIELYWRHGITGVTPGDAVRLPNCSYNVFFPTDSPRIAKSSSARSNLWRL